MSFDAKKLTWSADQDIYLKSINGSILLDAGAGYMVDVNTLPLAGDVDDENGRGQYKLCMCKPQGQLFRVPVPVNNNKRTSAINCASFTNPCTGMHM